MSSNDTPDPEIDSTVGSDQRETSDAEMDEELRRLGLAGDLVAIVLKRQASEVVSFGSPIFLLPVNILVNSLKGGFESEAMTLGLRQTVEKLRPFGPTISLGESLLSLARASRMYEPPEVRYEWILEAIEAFQQVKAEKRMGRAYLDLGTALKDGQELYDALRAFEISTETCETQHDSGGLAASYYHRAHICRLLGQEFEALQLLDKADERLPISSSAERWRKQIMSERIFNNLQLRRDSEALKYTDQWIDSGDEHFFPFFYRAEIRERSGDLNLALADYCTAGVALSQDILKNKTDRFRRVDRARSDSMFRRALKLSLRLEKPEIALALLQLANTGGMGLLTPWKSIEDEDESVANALSELRERATSLSREALRAVSQHADDELRRYNKMADWLISEQEFLYAGDDEQFIKTEELTMLSARIKAAIPPDAALIEFTTVDDEVWLLSVTNESISASKLSFTSFDIRLLASSFAHECDGMFSPTALTALGNELVVYLGPVLQIKGSLIIAPNPEFYGIPLQAINWNGTPLVETHEVSYITSSLNLLHNSQTMMTERINSYSNCVFIGTPNVDYSKVADLPGVRDEIESISSIFNAANLRVELPGTSSDLLDLNTPPKVLHVACHGQFEPSAPLFSRLLMRDRPIFAFEIMLAELHADVAVISACQTAQGVVGAGSHTQSLASAFLKAGVKNVVAALWPVDDEAGAFFIKEFYRTLINGSLPIAALHFAQRELRRRPEFQHPYFWAPFTIFGAPQRNNLS